MTVNTWGTIASVGTVNAVRPAGVDDANMHIMAAWGGGAIDIVNQQLWVTGGGHGDGNYNDLFRLPLNVSAPAWIRDTLTSSNTPAATHSGGTFIYCPSTDEIWRMMEYGVSPSGNNSRDIYKHSSGAWSSLIGSYPVDFTTQTSGTTYTEGGSCYDPVTGLLWGFTKYGQAYTIDPTVGSASIAARTTTTGASTDFFNPVFGEHYSIAIWSDARVIIAARPQSNELQLLDINSPSTGWRQCSPTTKPTNLVDFPGVFWRNRNKQLYVWGQTSNRTEHYTLSPPTTTPSSISDLIGTWTWATITIDGSNTVTPSNPALSGSGRICYGRWNYIEDLGGSGSGCDMALLVNDEDEPTYTLRLA